MREKERERKIEREREREKQRKLGRKDRGPSPVHSAIDRPADPDFRRRSNFGGGQR